MRVLFIAPRYHTNQHYWVKSLQEAGHHVAFLVISREGLEETSRLTPEVLPLSRTYRLLKRIIPGRNDKKHGWASIATVLRHLRAEAPDAVVIRDPLLPMSWRAVLAARALRLRIVLYTQRERRRSRMGAKIRVLQAVRRLAGNVPMITPVEGGVDVPGVGAATDGGDAAGVRVAAGADRHEAAAPLVPRGWHHVPFVMEPDPAGDYDSREWCPDGVRRVVMVAKYLPRKNHMLLVQALESLVERYPIQLDIFGGHDTPEYRREYEAVGDYIYARGLHWIRRFEPVSWAELQRHLHAYDLYILPSRDEQVGVSLLEAMGKGLPVIASTTAGARDYIEHGGNGRIFQSDSLEDLRVQADVLLRDPAILRSAGRRSLELVLTRYSPRAFLERFMPLVQPQGSTDTLHREAGTRRR